MTATATSETAAVELSARQRWLAVLAQASRAAIEAQWQAQAGALALPAFTWLRPPQVGMVMLRARAGGTGAAFNLGEATLTRCTLRCAGGRLGSGQVLGRDAAHATWVARLDAALQDPALHERLMQAVVEPLAQAQRAQRESASRTAAASRVEFFTLVRGT